MMLQDPVMRWLYANIGAVRWSEIGLEDPAGILVEARAFGLRFGAAASCFDANADGERSYGIFVRRDREFSDGEIERLAAHVVALHAAKAAPASLTEGEVEVLRLSMQGLRIKQIAYALDLSESAIKQRIKSARGKLDARTGLQAVSLAREYGLI